MEKFDAYWPHQKLGRRYTTNHEKYSDTLPRKRARSKRSRIGSDAFKCYHELRIGRLPEDYEVWIREHWVNDHGVTDKAYQRKAVTRADGSPFFRAVKWPPQDKHDRCVNIPSPSQTDRAYSSTQWTKQWDKRLFRQVVIKGHSLRRFAIDHMSTELDCTERYRELYSLPLNREHRHRVEWTADEDRELLQWVDDLRERDWIRISHFVRHHPETSKYRYRLLKGADFNTEIMDEDEADIKRPYVPPFLTPASPPPNAEKKDDGETDEGPQTHVPSPPTNAPHPAPAVGAASRKISLDEDYDVDVEDGNGNKGSDTAHFSPSKRVKAASLP